MFNEVMTNKRMAILIVLVQFALLAVLIFYPNEIVVVAAILSFVAAAIVWRFGFMIKPAFAKHAHIIEGFGKYEISQAQDVIVKKHGNRYFAATYLLVNFTQSSTEKSADQVMLTRQGYERALSSLNYVYKISNMVCPVDLTGFVDKIKEKRSKAEARLSELASLPQSSNQGSEMARLRREIESCGKQLEKILGGERPMKVVNFVMTCASSPSRDDAISKTKQQAAEIKTVVSSTLDTEVKQLTGDDMKQCFEWEHMLPEKEGIDEFLY